MKDFAIRTSIFLMIFSFVPWLLIPTLPLWPMSGPSKVAAVPILFVAAEIIFWGGLAIGGTEMLRHKRRYGIVFKRRIGSRMRRWLRLKKRA
jgi:hypothetical protein